MRIELEFQAIFSPRPSLLTRIGLEGSEIGLVAVFHGFRSDDLAFPHLLKLRCFPREVVRGDIDHAKQQQGNENQNRLLLLGIEVVKHSILCRFGQAPVRPVIPGEMTGKGASRYGDPLLEFVFEASVSSTCTARAV